MQTEAGVLRHQTTAAEVGLASLANDDQSAALDEAKSKVHFIWNPFGDIELVGPDGLVIRLGKGRSYYGQGKPKETLQEYQARKGDKLRRCFMYPLWNITYMDTIANTGDFQPADMLTNPDPRQGNQRLRLVERGQYAGVCAADLISRYGESHGARVLEPLIGMDNTEMATAEELFKLVQPNAYKLDSPYEDDQETLLFDLSFVAKERIVGAKLDATLAASAERLRVIMLGGTRQAIKRAKEEMSVLDDSMANAKLGRPGKARPTTADEHLCFLLGEPIPAAVARPPREGAAVAPSSSDRLETAVSMLTDIVAGQRTASAAPDDTEAQQLIAELRAERDAARAEREMLAEAREQLREEQDTLAQEKFEKSEIQVAPRKKK